MAVKRRTEIIVETDRVFVIRGRRSLPGWCPECAGQARMVRVEEASAIARVSSRAIYQRVESGQVHFTEAADGLLLVCLNSLRSKDLQP